MTYRDKTRYLRRYRECVDKIKSLQAEREEVSVLSAQRYDRIGHSTTVSSAVENTAIRLEQYEEQITQEMNKLIDLRNDINAKINTLRNPRYRIVATMYYINGWNSDRIAEELDKDDRTVWHLIKAATNHIEFKEDENGKN